MAGAVANSVSKAPSQEDAGDPNKNLSQDHFIDTKARDKGPPLPAGFGDTSPGPVIQPVTQTHETEDPFKNPADLHKRLFGKTWRPSLIPD